MPKKENKFTVVLNPLSNDLLVYYALFSVFEDSLYASENDVILVHYSDEIVTHISEEIEREFEYITPVAKVRPFTSFPGRVVRFRRLAHVSRIQSTSSVFCQFKRRPDEVKIASMMPVNEVWRDCGDIKRTDELAC